MKDADRERPVRRSDEDLVSCVENRARGAEERVRPPPAEVHLLPGVDLGDAQEVVGSTGDGLPELGQPGGRPVAVERVAGGVGLEGARVEGTRRRGEVRVADMERDERLPLRHVSVNSLLQLREHPGANPLPRLAQPRHRANASTPADSSAVESGDAQDPVRPRLSRARARAPCGRRLGVRRRATAAPIGAAPTGIGRPVVRRTPRPSPAHSPPSPTRGAFLDQVDVDLRELWTARDRAHWVEQTYITADTEALRASGEAATAAYVAKKAHEAQRFASIPLPDILTRKLSLLVLTQDVPAPDDPAKAKELASLMAAMDGAYGEGQYCPPKGSKLAALLRKGETCLHLDALERGDDQEPRPRAPQGGVERLVRHGPPAAGSLREVRRQRERRRARASASPTWGRFGSRSST